MLISDSRNFPEKKIKRAILQLEFFQFNSPLLSLLPNIQSSRHLVLNKSPPSFLLSLVLLFFQGGKNEKFSFFYHLSASLILVPNSHHSIFCSETAFRILLCQVVTRKAFFLQEGDQREVTQVIFHLMSTLPHIKCGTVNINAI